MRGLLGPSQAGPPLSPTALPGHCAPDMPPCYKLDVLRCQSLPHPQKAFSCTCSSHFFILPSCHCFREATSDCPGESYVLLTPVSLFSALFLPLTFMLHVTYCLGKLNNLSLSTDTATSFHQSRKSSPALWPSDPEWGMSSFHL